MKRLTGVVLALLVTATAASAISLSEARRVVQGVERVVNHVAKSARPSVATVVTTNRIQPRVHGMPPRLFERFFDRLPERKRQGLGTGFVVRSDGYLLTNHHVVKQADSIEVTFDGESDPIPARVVASSERSDLSVLKIDRTNLEPLDFADNIKVGQLAVAIGAPFRLPNSVSVGYVSAVGRTLQDAGPQNLVQTDAAINQGNSGGPLLNADGEVLGVNTFILSEGARGSQGVGFAVAAPIAQKVARRLIDVQDQIGSRVGFLFEAANSQGVRVVDIITGTKAARTALKPGDLVLAINDRPVNDPSTLRETLQSDRRVVLTVRGAGGRVRRLVLSEPLR